MTSLKRPIVDHKWALVMAFLAALIIASPQIYFRLEHRNDDVNKGIEMLPDSPWSSRSRDIQDGNLGFGNMYQKDGKDNPYLLQPLGSIVVAYSGKIFGLDINNTFLLFRLLFTFVTFLLIYTFVYLTTSSKSTAITSASLWILAEGLLSFFGISSVLKGEAPGSFLRMGRPVNPAMIYIPFFSFLIAFYNFYIKRGWRFGVLSAVLLGLNFYNYFYAWTYLYAFLGVLVLAYLIQREWYEAKRIIFVMLGAVLMAVPYAINLYQASLFPTYEEVGMRLGIVYSHAPFFVGLTVIAALLLYIFGFPRDDRRKFIFGLALLLAPFVTMNQQILTGKVLQEDHYHWFFHKPMALFFVLAVIFYWVGKKGFDKFRKPLVALMVIISLGFGIYTQIHSYKYGSDGGEVLLERQKYGPVMDWLNENGERNEVVLGNEFVSRIVPIYTPLNVYYHRAAMYSLTASHVRLLEILFTFYRLSGIDASNVRERFYEDKVFISWNIFGIYYRELYGAYEATPDEKIEEIISDYKETLATPKSEWIRQRLEKYEVNYVVWDKKEDPTWNLDQYKFLKKEAEFGDLSIYSKI